MPIRKAGKDDYAPEGDARSIAAIGGQLWQRQLLSLMTSVNKWPVSLVCVDVCDVAFVIAVNERPNR